MNNRECEERKELRKIQEQHKLDQKCFAAFVNDLTELSKKYGIIIQSTGGVLIFDDPKKVEGLVYTNDASSGDLYHSLPGDEEA